ncbi:MAG: NAD-dependent malic enzyme [Proteobacteria bacterium]|nr:NAD-dependent malic enzyme [Pseudomonadota bacterium]MBU1738996.1 NAD-dependent malic enzyme [Pseudomonadota bacterium]
MPQSTHGFRYDEFGNTSEILLYTRGSAVLASNYTNKGTAFTHEERKQLNLSGSLPPAVRPLKRQVIDSNRKVAEKADDIERFIYMRALFDRNVTLAHAVIRSDIEKYMKIIYTPTVGLACQQYSSMFRTANGLHFYPGNIGKAETILRRYLYRDIRVAVVTDNQGILGIGDQGAGGIAICLGKLMLYTQGAGIAPWHCLPISLDVGTNNQTLLEDENYLGWRHERLTGDEYVDFLQQFARAFSRIFPNAICQWEDFSKQNAYAIRDAYLHDLVSFNDDIQGTGAVTLAGVISAMKIKGERLEDQTYLVHGAGAGGIGVAEQILAGLVELGMTEKEALKRIFTIDSRGLVTSCHKNDPYKCRFARNIADLSWYGGEKDGDLLNVVRKAGVTVLIGTSGQTGCFSREVVEAMLGNCERPVIMPLSNPTSKAEAVPQDIYEWTGGRALVATGSPFEPVAVDGKKIRVGQGNNVFVFPGVGLGVLTSGAKEILPQFFTAAAHAVSECVSAADLAKGILYPPVTELREVSRKVALAVGQAAIRQGVSRPCVFSSYWHENSEEKLAVLIEKMRWKPEYLPLVSL